MSRRAIVFVSTVQNPEETLGCSDNLHLDATPDNEIVNDFDLIAVEKAVQLKEAGLIDEVIVFSLAPSRNHLLKMLAMGADRAVWGESNNARLSPEIVVNTVLSAFEPDQNTIWMLGKMGVNFESHLTAQILAHRLNVPCLCSCFDMAFQNEKWQIFCEDDGGIAHYQLKLPFVVTSELRLAEPRFPALPSIIKAKKKPVESVAILWNDDNLSTKHLALAEEHRRTCRMMSADEFCCEMQSILKAGV